MAANGQGYPDDAFTNIIREEMKKILAEGVQGGGQAAAGVQGTGGTPQPLEVTVGGQLYRFENSQQLSQAIESMVKQNQDALAAAQAQAAQAAQAQGQQQVQEPPKGPDLERFVETLKQDPAQAINDAIQQKYGVGIEQVLGGLQEMEATKRVMVGGRFKDLHPEFPASPQTAQVLDNARQALGLPWTVDGLEAAYMMAVSRGAIRPDWSAVQGRQGQGQDQGQGGYQGQPQAAQNWGPPGTMQPQQSFVPQGPGLAGFGGRTPGQGAPPPVPGVRGGSELAPDIESMAHQMNADQLEKFIRGQFPGA